MIIMKLPSHRVMRDLAAGSIRNRRSRVAPSIQGMSKTAISLAPEMGLTRLVNPRTDRIFIMLDPMMLPTEISVSFFRAAITLVARGMVEV